MKKVRNVTISCRVSRMVLAPWGLCVYRSAGSSRQRRKSYGQAKDNRTSSTSPFPMGVVSASHCPMLQASNSPSIPLLLLVLWERVLTHTTCPIPSLDPRFSAECLLQRARAHWVRGPCAPPIL